MTIFGTRPEIIRLSLVMKILDQHCEHVTVHTGQNYDESLSDIFIRDLEVRTPDVHFGIKADSFGSQIGQILSKTDEVMEQHKPDRLLLLGDTNSALSGLLGMKLMEELGGKSTPPADPPSPAAPVIAKPSEPLS